MMEVFEAVRTMLAVRRYLDRAVPETIVQRIVEAGRLTGSAMNLQPWHFIVIQDRDTLRREVKDLLASGLRLQIAPGDVPDDAPIFGEALGLDSIDALELVVLVEDRFHVSIPDEEVGRRAFGSVNALVDFILAERPG